MFIHRERNTLAHLGEIACISQLFERRCYFSQRSSPLTIKEALFVKRRSSKEKLFLELRLCMEPILDCFYPDKAIGSISIVYDYSYKLRIQATGSNHFGLSVKLANVEKCKRENH